MENVPDISDTKTYRLGIQPRKDTTYHTPVRVISTRIARLCLEHNILRGPNFGGLLGGHTKMPIHTLHNVMEDAKNNKKALWIAFQDMSKAFDSIGMVPLRHALARIRLPPGPRKLIIDVTCTWTR